MYEKISIEILLIALYNEILQGLYYVKGQYGLSSLE